METDSCHRGAHPPMMKMMIMMMLDDDALYDANTDDYDDVG